MRWEDRLDMAVTTYDGIEYRLSGDGTALEQRVEVVEGTWVWQRVDDKEAEIVAYLWGLKAQEEGEVTGSQPEVAEPVTLGWAAVAERGKEVKYFAGELEALRHAVQYKWTVREIKDGETLFL